MPSTYDEEKKCRVGTMDEKQFHAECAKENGAYFRALLTEWEKSGGKTKWGASGLDAETLPESSAMNLESS